MAGSGVYCDCGRQLGQSEGSWTCFKCREKRLMDRLEAKQEAEAYELDRNADGSLRDLVDVIGERKR